jgi:hypothetical protein
MKMKYRRIWRIVRRKTSEGGGEGDKHHRNRGKHHTSGKIGTIGNVVKKENDKNKK